MIRNTTQEIYNLERFFSLSPDIICVAGFDGYFKKINPALSNLLGYSEEELLEKPIQYFIHKEDILPTTISLQSLLNNTPLVNFQNRYITKSGETVWLSWSSILEDRENVVYAIAKNITHLKTVENERNNLLKNLTSLNSSLKKFSYMVSHDLRSPVSNIISIFELLDLSQVNDQDTRENIEYINEANLEIKKTLNKYVDVIKSNKNINTDVEFLNIARVFSKVKNSIEELSKNTNAKFDVDFTELPYINFNKLYLQSIFLNLITNSLKFNNPKNPLIITIKSKLNNDIPQLIFSDNGRGFDENTIGKNIFKLKNSHESSEESKGIGLYLVKSYMDCFNGEIQVSSKLNVGTTFTLTFST
ncbi:PAS domain S-box-containing protein [Mesonia algae]|uniref:histidine kinase n=1 Tax=Mesonia algae TaxID=213248 RepID=A0A2W7IUM2_9FLAO|nr:PAS domain-containing sensor histidine kinase [Mesonia algae]PZW42373.1 PAS domain S-box-containing protein [Mesonia algae]